MVAPLLQPPPGPFLRIRSGLVEAAASPTAALSRRQPAVGRCGGYFGVPLPDDIDLSNDVGRLRMFFSLGGNGRTTSCTRLETVTTDDRGPVEEEQPT